MKANQITSSGSVEPYCSIHLKLTHPRYKKKPFNHRQLIHFKYWMQILLGTKRTTERMKQIWRMMQRGSWVVCLTISALFTSFPLDKAGKLHNGSTAKSRQWKGTWNNSSNCNCFIRWKQHDMLMQKTATRTVKWEASHCSGLGFP